MPGEIDMCAKLPGELKCLDQALEHGIAPVENGFAEFNRTFRNTAPVWTVVVHLMSKIYPFQFFGFIKNLPQFIHFCAPSVFLFFLRIIY